MIAFLSTMTEWHWLIFGLVLIAAEVMAPGAFLLWPGLAAILVGLLQVFIPAMPWTASIGIWALFSLLTIGGFILYRRKNPNRASENTLNRRGTQYTGQVFTLEKPVINGKGELRVDDTVWKVVADQDMTSGVKITVLSVEGTALRISPFIPTP